MIIPLTKNLSMIDAPNRSKYPYCNCLYINDEIRTVIDNSCGQDNLDFLLAQNIDVVINSHFHEDHVINNKSFTRAEIWAHRLDAPAIRSMEIFQEYYGMGDMGYGELAIEFITSMNLKGSVVNRELEDGDILDLGSTRFLVINTPGHTPGHCCFYEEAEGFLFSSDIDLSSFGPWYGHKCSNLDDYIESIRKCMTLKPKIVVSSHNGIIRDDIEGSFQRYLEVIFRKEELVRSSLLQPSTLDDLAEKCIFYGDTLQLEHPFFKIAEKMAIKCHLNRLLRLNEVHQEGEVYYLS